MTTKNSDDKTIAKIGFGCGRLVGGSSLKESAKLVEAALELGIRHFDVAPSYGLGTAEDVLGIVLAGEKDVTIATKVGIARPSGGQSLSLLRKYLSPILKSSAGLKSLALKTLAKQTKRGVFDCANAEKSFEDSLRRLKRDKVDYLLLHEPASSDITEELIAYCEGLVLSNHVGRLGLGFNGHDIDQTLSFGTVLQRRVGNLLDNPTIDNRTQIIHGVMRMSSEQIGGMLTGQESNINDAFKQLCWDTADSSLYGSTALGLALVMKNVDMVLVSFSDINKMKQTFHMSERFISALNSLKK
jgi:aryl-alcohol dehydrogenase-like predicted oxidoreductase